MVTRGELDYGADPSYRVDTTASDPASVPDIPIDVPATCTDAAVEPVDVALADAVRVLRRLIPTDAATRRRAFTAVLARLGEEAR